MNFTKICTRTAGIGLAGILACSCAPKEKEPKIYAFPRPSISTERDYKPTPQSTGDNPKQENPKTEDPIEKLLEEIRKQKYKIPEPVQPKENLKPAEKPTLYRPDELRGSVQMHAGRKFALKAKEKPDPVLAIGMTGEVFKNRFGGYFGFQYSSDSETEESDISELTARWFEVEFKAGPEYYIIDTKKWGLAAGAGGRLIYDDAEITGRIGSKDIKQSDSCWIIGAEARICLEYRLDEVLTLSAAAVYGHNFKGYDMADNSELNTTDDLTIFLGIKGRF